MICAKCEKCQENIPEKEVLEIVVEKIKQKREKKEKTKRKPRAASEYNKFLSEYLKKPELKDILPKCGWRKLHLLGKNLDNNLKYFYL